MKILLVTNRIPWPLHDGGAMCMYQSMKGYIDQEIETSLLAMNTTKHHVKLPIDDEYFSRLQDFQTIDIDNDVKPIGAFRNLFQQDSYVLARFISHDFSQKLAEMIEKIQPDVVQFETLFTAYYIDELKPQFPQVNMVYRMHNVEHEIWNTLSDMGAAWRRWYLGLISKRLRHEELRILASADQVLCISPEDAEWVDTHTPQVDKRVYPFAIDPLDFEQNIDRPLNFYHLGSMDWPPNQDAMNWWLRDIWPHFGYAEDYPFYMAGRHMDITRYPQPTGAHLVGEVQDVDDFLADKSVLVVPLRSGSGMRIKVLEAMQRSIVVISTSIGITGIAGKPGTHYLIADTPEEFVAQMNMLVADPSMLEDIASAARELVAEYYDLPSQIRANLKFFG